MPYFLHRESRQVRVTPPGTRLGDAYIEIPTDVAIAHSLVDNDILSEERATTLLSNFESAGSDGAGSTATTGLRRAAPVNGGVTESTLKVVSSAKQIALIVEIIAWVLAVGSVIAGLVLATTTRDFDEGLGLTDVRHPFVATGAALAVGGLFQCLIIVMVARYIRARMLLAQER